MPAHYIGQNGSPAVALFREHGLTPLRRVLPPEMFDQVWPQKPHPNAILVPPVVFWLMCVAALSDGTLAAAVASFWTCLQPVCPALRLQSVTEEAFCMARNALPMCFFHALFDTFIQRQEELNTARWRWHGLRLLGIDGTKLNLPPVKALHATYPPPRNARGAARRPQALLVGLVGLMDGMCYHFVLVPQQRGEQWCACLLTRYLSAGDLLLADRNFPCYEILARIRHRGAEFLFHLPAKRFHKLPRRPTNSGRRDEWLVDLTLPAALRKRCPHLPPVTTVRILQYQRPGYRTSWLVTSLTDARAYPYDKLVSLYHKRWNQETMHREWKHTLKLANLRSHSPSGICKEVFVQLTLNNAVRALQAEALPSDATPLSLSFLDAKRSVVTAIPVMALVPVVELPTLYAALLRKIATFVILVRPGRSYPRLNEGKPRNKGHGRIIPSAKLTIPTGKPKKHV